MTAPCHLVLASLALLASVARGGSADRWPRFRGPDGAGISNATTIPVRWSDKNCNWKVTLPGSGHSSPVVWGRRIFLTCADEKTARRIVCCLAVADGRLRWKRDFPSQRYRQHSFNSYASASPAADAQRVYVTWTTPKEVTLLALTHDGADVWRRNLGPFRAIHGSGTSPIVFDDLVVLACDQEGPGSFLIAVDAATGITRWRIARRSSRAAYGTPCVYRPPDGPPQLVFTSTSHGITGVDPRAGKVIWEAPGVFPQRCASSPVVVAGLLFGTAGIGGRGRSAAAVRPGSPDGKTPATVAYRLKSDFPYVPTAVTKGDLLFVLSDQGVLTCLRGATGQVVWKQKLGADFFGSPVRVGDRLYAISKKGDVFVLAAGEQFRLLARTPLGERSYATPAVAGGCMFLRTTTHLISIGVSGSGLQN